MIDVTNVFEDAATRSSVWSAAAATKFLRDVEGEIPSARVDWEPEDEAWGRVLVGKDVAIIVHSALPLAIAVARFADTIRNISDSSKISLIEVADFETPCLSADKPRLETLLSRSLSSAVDYANISMQDLWWATV
jgi:hypothetical protein